MTSSQNPLVSVVVPCYNYGRYLPDCLRSIFEQDADYPLEIIAIDDCSQDNTQEVLRTFADPRLRVFTHPQNRGHIVTVSEGLEMARGKYVARIDPDDRYQPRFLSTLIPKLEQYPEVGMAYGDAAIIDAEGRVNLASCDSIHQGRDFKGRELTALLLRNFICAPTAIARREAWLQAMPLPAGLAFNDWYFNLMIARRYEMYYAHQVVAHYRVHSQNHHTKIVQDRSEEPSIFFVLDRLYESECSAGTAQELRAVRRRAYAAQYLMLADKYFGAHMNEDARRCYWQAMRRRPSYWFSGATRRLAATMVSRNIYERGKAWLRQRTMSDPA